MTEHRSPIPGRIYNAAVGGHVCGPEDLDFGQKVVHLILQANLRLLLNIKL